MIFLRKNFPLNVESMIHQVTALVASPLSNLSKSKYRPEIDGLRAFAVLAVIANHFNNDILPGGYLGVDIFFVISGYVITSSLAGRNYVNFIDFLKAFYIRRLKRLVPALVVMVLITSVLICLFNPEPGAALKTGGTALFGFSNLYLFKQSTDYFADSTSLNPFTHTWSLGVEEQFYLLFPFLIWFSGFARKTVNGARNLFLLVSTLTIISFICFLALNKVNQPAAYFLMPPRFWEMAVGCLMFIGFRKHSSIEQTLEKIPPILAISAVFIVMLLPNNSLIESTLFVVILTVVLIVCIKKGTLVYDIFVSNNFVFIGLISYSLYLWHWSVLSISRWTVGIHWWSAPIQLLLIFIISIASYRFVEQPLRLHNSFSFSVVFIPLIATLALIGSFLDLTKNKFKNALYLGDSTSDYMDGNAAWDGVIPYQSINPYSKHSIVVVGNSWAGQLLPLIKRVSDHHNLSYRVLQTGFETDKVIFKPIPSIKGKSIVVGNSMLNIDSLKFPLPETNINSNSLNLSPNSMDKELINYFKQSLRYDILLLSSRHINLYQKPFEHNGRFYYQDSKSDFGQPLNSESLGLLWENKLRLIIDAAYQRGVRVIFMAPYPEFTAKLEPSINCSKQWFRKTVPDNCIIAESRDHIKSVYIPSMHKILQKLQNEHSNFYVFYPFSVFCPSKLVSCSTSNEAGSMYSDNDHLSVRGALHLLENFNNFLSTNSLIKK